MEEVIARIVRMERCFDALRTAAAEAPGSLEEDIVLKQQLAELVSYYENGQWLRDYEMDEQRLLPPTLKRGILAQDAVYDFLDGLPFVPSELTEEDRHEV